MQSASAVNANRHVSLGHVADYRNSIVMSNFDLGAGFSSRLQDIFGLNPLHIRSVSLGREI